MRGDAQGVTYESRAVPVLAVVAAPNRIAAAAAAVIVPPRARDPIAKARTLRGAATIPLDVVVVMVRACERAQLRAAEVTRTEVWATPCCRAVVIKERENADAI